MARTYVFTKIEERRIATGRDPITGKKRGKAPPPSAEEVRLARQVGLPLDEVMRIRRLNK